MKQISLPLDWNGQGGRDHFLVSDANALAVRHLDRWKSWPVAITALSGPPHSGKSTLGRLFARKSGGVVIDNADSVAQEALFHAWNRAQTDHVPLLLISAFAPQDWAVTLPDLQSRLSAVPHVAIREPDEALALALIEQGLARSGAAFSPDVPQWLHRRTERSYAAIAAMLTCLNEAALSSGRKISLPMVKEALQAAGLLPI